jgi:lysozyme
MIRHDDHALLHTTRIHEGFRSRLYHDSHGNLTIGYGCNISSGISIDEAEALMREHYKSVINGLLFQEWFNDLSANRQRAMAEMAYQLGWAKVKRFRKMLAALALKDYEQAADEMLDSLWAQQTPVRAKHCAKLMRAG